MAMTPDPKAAYGTAGHTSGHSAGAPGDESRRDFIYIMTGAVGAIGAAAVAWPFIDTMNPSADVLALSTIEVNLAPVQPGQSITVMWRGKPVFIRNRTPEEVKAAQDVKLDVPKEVRSSSALNVTLQTDAPPRAQSRAQSRAQPRAQPRVQPPALPPAPLPPPRPAWWGWRSSRRNTRSA